MASPGSRQRPPAPTATLRTFSSPCAGRGRTNSSPDTATAHALQRKAAALSRNGICAAAQPVPCADGGDHARLRLSLKERVYALSGPDGAPERCGILIYTATAGAQGTLGGLVGTAPRFAQILRNALERSRICSNDPVCADHEPDNRSGDRATHGAACHGCLLIAETSCEMRNLFLDRSLLVPTMGTDGASFFQV